MPPVPRKPKPPTCDDCYFHKNLLCALELNEPCATFRPNRPEGLVPPRQPVLLMRAPRWASRLRRASFSLPARRERWGVPSACWDFRR